MRNPQNSWVRLIGGLVLPALEDFDVETDFELAADGYSSIVRLPKSDVDLRHVVSNVLNPSVWWQAKRTPGPKPGTERTRAQWLPRWSGLSEVSRDDVPRLLEAWGRATSRRGVADFIRVSVNPYERSDLLRLARRLRQPIVPGVRWLSGVAFTWSYPIRVTAAGSSRDRLLQELRELPGAGSDFVFSDEQPDVCFVSGYDEDPELDCGIVLAIGRRDAAKLFGAAIWNDNATNGVAAAAGVPRNDLAWWPGVVAALTHNLPLDCALASVVPNSCVGGISAALTATTLSAESGGWHGPPTTTRFVGPGTLPDMEGEGFELGRGVAASQTQAPADRLGEDHRRLMVEFRDGTKKVRAVLPPNREVSMEVSIGVPKRGRLIASEPVVVPDADEPTPTLDLVAHCTLWSEPQRSQVAWSVGNYNQDSTTAVFAFRTGNQGAIVITIDLLYRGRVIQKADIVAAVRDTALAGERIRVEARHTSATTGTTLPAGICLDATGSELRNIRTGFALPLAPLDGVAGAIEMQASRVLGSDRAPENLASDGAKELLITLARQGAALRDQLEYLGLDRSNGDVVSLLVHEQTPVLPLELIYEGEPPKPGARLCKHVSAPPPPGEACSHISSRVVCPYAFWSLNRTVVRTVLLPNARARRLPNVLRLTPALFAASELADLGAPPDARPSDALADACERLLGGVIRVRTWSSWRRQIRVAKPELLVLLAHTQVDAGWASLQIGKRSFLARPDISAAIVGDSPLVLMIACASAMAGDPFGTLPGTLTARGASAVVGSLTGLSGEHGSRAATAVLTAICAIGRGSLSTALGLARRDLVAQGLMVGMLLVAHGEIEVAVRGEDPN